jgi:hypothetical protein
MNLQERLSDLLDRYEGDLPEYAWAQERRRWEELAFCLLDRCTSVDSDTVRAGVDTLAAAGLLTIENARTFAAPDDPRTIAASHILRHHAFSDDEIQLALHVLSGISSRLASNHLGMIQRLVRPYAEAFRNALVDALSIDALPADEAAYAVTQWLQNTANLPISLLNTAVVAFCEEEGCSSDELFNAADALAMNLAVVDDLMALAFDAGEIGAAAADEPAPSGNRQPIASEPEEQTS